MDATATLRSPVHVDRQDPKYRMYHSNRYDDGFGTRYIPPLTRDEHSKREYLGAPYQFAADNEDNPFESSCLTNRLPSPEPGFGRRVFLQGSLSEVVEHWDGEDDFSTPGGEWYWRQREEEEVSTHHTCAEPPHSPLCLFIIGSNYADTHHSIKTPSSQNSIAKNSSPLVRILHATPYPSLSAFVAEPVT